MRWLVLLCAAILLVWGVPPVAIYLAVWWAKRRERE